MLKVNGTSSAAGLRAFAAAIKPTAADYEAAAIVGAGMDALNDRSSAARYIEHAATIKGRHQRASYLRSHGIDATA